MEGQTALARPPCLPTAFTDPLLPNAARGGAYGFKIETLGKLVTVKSSDNSRTLLEYLAEQLEEKDPELANFPASMDKVGAGHGRCVGLCVCADGMEPAFVQVSEALKVPLGQIQADVTLLAKGVRVVKTQLELAEKAEKLPNDRFVEVMKPFYERAQEVRGRPRRHRALPAV